MSTPPDPASPTSVSAGAQAAIVFIKEPSSQDALQGRRALLRCEVEALGPLEVHWLLNGVPVQDTERRFAQGSSLSFAAVDRLQDSGAFQCVARDNITGEEARSANASFNIKCESLFRGRVLCLCIRQTQQPSPGSLVPQFLLLSVEWGKESLAVVLLVWLRETCLSLLSLFFHLSSSCFPTLSSPLHPSSPSLPLSLLCAEPRVPHMPSIHYYHSYFPSLPATPLQVPFICQRLSWTSLACIECDLPGTGPVIGVCPSLTVASQYLPARVAPEPAGSQVSSSPSTFPCCSLSVYGLCFRDRGRSCGPEASSLRSRDPAADPGHSSLPH